VCLCAAGCTNEAWIDVQLSASGTVTLRGDSDAKITAGFAGVLAAGLDGGERSSRALDLRGVGSRV
jgi:sulfur transfer protein SufE